MARRFNLAEAEARLGEIGTTLRQAAAVNRQLAEVVAQLEEVSRRVTFSGGALVNLEQLSEVKARGDSLGIRLREIIESVQEHGCLVKDLNMGLVDFPTTFQGREVYLCWKLGEDGIQFWHEVEDGYRGRRPIDQDFLDHHRGDPPD